METSARKRRIGELDLQLKSLENSQVALQGQLTELGDRMRLLQLERASLAAVNELPDDILVLIIEEVCVHDFHHFRIPTHHAIDPPIILSHVNRRWRNLALSLPKIWQCIHIIDPIPVRYDEIVELYIARSGQMPLSIVAFLYNEDELPAHTPPLHHCWGVLFAAAERWTHFTVRSIDPEVLGYLQTLLIDIRLPRLEYLQVDAHDDILGWPLAVTECWQSPQFTHLRLLQTIFPASQALLGNVVKLCLHAQPVDIVFLARVSLAAPRLTDLTLSQLTIEEDGDDVDPPLSFPNLHRLTMANFAACDIMRCLEAPSLKTLWLLCPEPIEEEEISDDRSLPSVVELCCFCCEYPYIFPFLTSTVVTSLVLSSMEAVGFIELMMPEQDKKPLPNLQTLVVYDLQDMDKTLLADVVKARAQHHIPLHTIRLHSLYPLDDLVHDLEPLEATVELVKTVEYPPELWAIVDPLLQLPR